MDFADNGFEASFTWLGFEQMPHKYVDALSETRRVTKNMAVFLEPFCELNDFIRKFFFIDEKNKQMGKQAKVDLDFSEPKKKKDEDELDFLDAQHEPEKNLLALASKEKFDKWFNKKFPRTANLDLSPLMEKYIKTLSRTSKYY